MNAEEKQIKVIFSVITKNTKYCASCGKTFDMKSSGHKHFPFCKSCRAGIIKRDLGTTERKS